jgi:hypothetical protein
MIYRPRKKQAARTHKREVVRHEQSAVNLPIVTGAHWEGRKCGRDPSTLSARYDREIDRALLVSHYLSLELECQCCTVHIFHRPKERSIMRSKPVTDFNTLVSDRPRSEHLERPLRSGD